MQLKPLELHPLAEEEYLSALDWYRSKSFQAAQDFEDVFWRAIYTVEDTPERWPVYFSFFRKYTIQKFPFSIV